jgi:glycosyltransferase involved in cell wall biosynthesis
VSAAPAAGGAAQPGGPRVLYVVSLFPCWSETFIVREIQALLRRGADVRVVSLRPASERLVQSDARALLPRVLYPPRGARGVASALGALAAAPSEPLRLAIRACAGMWRRPLRLAKTLVTLWRSLALADTLADLAPAHVHAHWATYPSTSALLLARLLRAPMSFTCHAHDIFVEDQLLAEKLGAAAFAVTISEHNRRHLARRYGETAARALEVVHCGVDLAEYPYEPRDRRPGTILGVGRLDAIKGFRHLVEACALLRRAGRELRCEIVGDGPLRAELSGLVARSGLTPVVTLPGALGREAVLERLRSAAVFALPSVVAPDGNRDGIPVALMEAMAVGTPVVSTTVSGIPELVRDAGLLVPPGDASALAAALARLLDDSELRELLAARARQRVAQRFDADREGARLLGLIAAAARRRGGHAA